MRSDEPDAFGNWAQPSLLAMTRLARRLAPDDAEDVVQNALLRAWQRWHTFDPSRGTVTTWLLAIVADQARGARRTRARRLRVVDDRIAAPDAPTADASLDVDLERAIGALSERQRLAVHLHYFVGLDVAETAAVMECSAGTVKSTLFDARANLRRLLGGHDDR